MQTNIEKTVSKEFNMAPKFAVHPEYGAGTLYITATGGKFVPIDKQYPEVIHDNHDHF